ncbi:unnamed protein product [Musa acuminata var. zebrina]
MEGAKPTGFVSRLASPSSGWKSFKVCSSLVRSGLICGSETLYRSRLDGLVAARR